MEKKRALLGKGFFIQYFSRFNVKLGNWPIHQTTKIICLYLESGVK